MEMVFRASAIYLILLVLVFKIAGRRALLQNDQLRSDFITDYQ